MDEFIDKKLTDVGTRYAHLQDLRGEWEAGVSILNGYKSLSKVEFEGLIKLTLAVDMLELTINAFSDYHNIDTEYKLKEMIDSIAPIKRLTDGDNNKC